MASRYIVVLLVLAVLGACANPYWRSYDLTLNPPGGVHQAKTECQLRASPTSGYDWIDAMMRRRALLKYCMYQFGYRFETERN